MNIPAKWFKALEPSVFCDGVELGRMDNGRYMMLKLKPGRHTVHMTDEKKGYDIDMRGGEIITSEPASRQVSGRDRAS